MVTILVSAVPRGISLDRSQRAPTLGPVYEGPTTALLCLQPIPWGEESTGDPTPSPHLVPTPRPHDETTLWGSEMVVLNSCPGSPRPLLVLPGPRPSSRVFKSLVPWHPRLWSSHV